MLGLRSRLPVSVANLRLTAALAAPFALIGLAIACRTAWLLLTLVMMQGWTVVPATLEQADLRSAGGSTQTVVVAYRYSVGGHEYTGHRFSIYGADNLGHFKEDAAATLQAVMAAHGTYPLHVDPHDPTQSVLMPVFRPEAIAFSLLFAVLFGGVGGAVIAACVARLARQRREADLLAQFPNEPWKQRVEWSGNRITSSLQFDAFVQLGLAIFWNLVTFPVLLVIGRELAEGHGSAVLFLLFPIVGLGLVAWAGIEVLRARRFGSAYLVLETMPGRPGSTLKGRIYAASALSGATTATVVLRCECVSRVQTESRIGNARNDATATVWEQSTQATVGIDQMQTGEVPLAIAFEIPSGVPSSARGFAEDYVWTVLASATLKGANFSSEFEIPVFAS